MKRVAYVCMTPRAFASPEQLADKRAAFLQGAQTSHWPHEVHIDSVGAITPGLVAGFDDAAARLAGFESAADLQRAAGGKCPVE